MTLRKLLFVVNVDWAFICHRLPVGLGAIAEGYEVHLATTCTTRADELMRYGFIVHPLQIDRGSINPFNALHTFFSILRLFLKIKPDLVHLVTIKPVIFGGIAARIARVPAVVSAIPGLGFAFTDKGVKARIGRAVAIMLYRMAVRHRNFKAIFQNPDDRQLITGWTGLHFNQTEMIRGSGVDLNVYRCRPLPEGVPVALMATRLLKTKGVLEFVDAVKVLRARGIEAEFWIAAAIDENNPAYIGQAQLNQWAAEYGIKLFLNHTAIQELMAQCHVVVLPSYREGVPKVLLEAAACGRAVLTTDVPGCRDAITPGGTGLLVPAKSVIPLADAMGLILKGRALQLRLGSSGRALAEAEFGIEQVVAKHLRIYEALIGG